MDSLFFGGFTLERVVSLMFTAIWILIDLGLAVVVFYRFRATLAGILMGGSLLLMSAKNFVSTALWELVLRPAMDRAYMGEMPLLSSPELYFTLKTVISLGLMLVLIAGVLAIPMSLTKLERRAAGLA